MIPFVLLVTVLLLAAVEILSRRENLRRLVIRFELDTPLVEPGEEVNLRYTVTNPSRFPQLCVGLTLRLDPVFTLHEEEAWTRRHAKVDFSGTRVDLNFFLAPGRKLSGKLRFSVKERGLFDFGSYYLESSDFLGLKPILRTGNVDLRIICTAPACPLTEVRALGGELGAISVRRFIQDDPSLVLGYREYSGREPMKQISWNQTAKAGRLIVRQNDYTTDRVATVIVNMDPSRPRLMERCLSLTRTVCQQLEDAHVPYGLQSNGDLFSLSQGLGRSHLFFIQRRIGLSRLTGYTGFPALIESCLRRKNSSCTYIIVTPNLNLEVRKAVARLRRYADREPLVLCAEEDAS